jgi:hypothetical protein
MPPLRRGKPEIIQGLAGYPDLDYSSGLPINIGAALPMAACIPDPSNFDQET